MYVSYGLSIPPVLVLMLVLWRLAGWSFSAAVVGAFIPRSIAPMRRFRVCSPY
jgi:hypothetical protein